MTRTVVAVLGATVLIGSTVQAHHGYANFFLDRTVTVEGDIESFRYANPHVVMEIRTDDSTVYTVMWQAALQLRFNAGVTSTTFKVGDRVIVSAAPPRNSESHELASVREVLRPRDGWDWKR